MKGETVTVGDHHHAMEGRPCERFPEAGQAAVVICVALMGGCRIYHLDLLMSCVKQVLVSIIPFVVQSPWDLPPPHLLLPTIQVFLILVLSRKAVSFPPSGCEHL